MNRLYNPSEVPVIREPRSEDFNGDQIDLKSIWAVFFRFKYLFIFSAFGVAVLGYIIASAMQPKFKASAELLINPPQQNIVDVDAFEQQTSSNGFIDSQVELIRSRVTAENVVRELNLPKHPIVNEFIDSSGAASLLSVRYWKGLFGLEDSASSYALPENERRRLFAVRYVVENQSISRVGVTDLVRISFLTTDRKLSAETANAVAKSYLARDRANRLAAIEEASAWLDGQIEEMRETVSADERAVEDYRARNNLVNAVGGSLTDQQRAEVNRQLVSAQGDLAEAEARLQRVQSIAQEGGDVESIAEMLSSDTISSMRREQALLTRRQAELLARYGNRHPSVVNVSAELQDIQSQIEAEAGRIINNISNDVALASSRVRALRNEQVSLDSDAALDEGARIELRELERRANASRQLYETLLDGYQASFVAGNAEALSPAALLVTPATAPNEPAFPNKKLFAALGGMLGFAIAMAYAFLKYFLDNKVRTLSELEARTTLAPLVSLPKLAAKNLDEKNLIKYLRDNQMSAYSESLKRLRGTLELAQVDNPPKLIQICSALPAEGKTTTAIALGTSYALAGQKTLLIDLDLRRPTVYKRLGIAKPKVGILSVFMNKAKLEDAITTDENGLDYLLNATAPVNSADIIGSAAMAKLLEMLKGRYDKVIVDSAPVLPIIDSALLSRRMDVVIMSVMWNETPGPAAAQGARILNDHGAYLLGGVLTGIDTQKAQGYARDGGYDDMRYYKRYGSYYSN